MNDLYEQMINLGLHYTECRNASINEEYELIEIISEDGYYELKIDLDESTKDEVRSEYQQAYRELKSSQQGE